MIMLPGGLRPHWCLAAVLALLVAPAPSRLDAQTAAKMGAGKTADGPRVSGRVIDQQGEPIAKATLTVVRFPSSHTLRTYRFEAREPEPEVEVRSDSDGYFDLRVPEAGMWALLVDAKGFAQASMSLVPVLRDRHLTPIMLLPSRTLTVQVETPDGQRAEDVLVSVDIKRDRSWRQRWRGGPSARPRRLMARTDDQGQAKLMVAAGGVMVVRAAATGGMLAKTEHGDGAQVTLTLPSDTRRTVVVRGEDGKPRAGAVVCVADALFPIGITDAEGRLEVAEPDPQAKGASTELVAITDDDEWGRSAWRAPEATKGDVVETEDDAEAPFVLVAEAPFEVAGTVVSASNQDPVPGALVWESADPSNHTHTDGRGRYTLPLYERDRQQIQAGAVGYFVETAALSKSAVASGEGPALPLEAGIDLRGIVVDANDEPVAGVEVTGRVDPSINRFNPEQAKAVSDAAGRFLLGPTLIDAPLRLTAERAGYAEVTVDVPAVAAGEPAPELRIRLLAGQRGVGYVLDLDEQPVVGAEVLLQPGVPAGTSFQALYANYDREPKRAETDGQGRFVFDDLGPRAYDLSITSPGFAPVVVPGITIAVGEPETDLGTILLEPGVVVEGVVVDPEDRPLAKASITVVRNTGLGVRARMTRQGEATTLTSDTAGRFTVVDLAPGQTVHLKASLDGYAPTSMVAIEVPIEEPLRLVLEPAGSVSGVVVDGRGDAVADAQITVEPDGTAARRVRFRNADAKTDEDGRFEIDTLASGTWRLTASASGHQPAAEGGLEITAGKAYPPLRLVLEAAAILEGTVYGPDGAPVAGAQVVHQSGATGGQPWARFLRGSEQGLSDGEGNFRLDRLAPGLQTFAVEHPDYRKLVRDVEVRVGDNRHDFRLDAGNSIRGQVVDAAGAPVRGASVSAQPSSGAFYGGLSDSTMTSADGSFEVKGLEDGTYTVTASREGHAAASTEEPVEVRGAPVQGVLLQLGSGTTIKGRVLGLSLDDLGQVQIMVISQSGTGGMSGVAQVDYEGRYRMENVSAGDIMLYAMVGSGARTVTEQLTIEAGETEREVDLDFGERMAVTGVVLDAGGAPAIGYRVYAVSADGGGMSLATTDGQGRFRIDGLEPGRHKVTVGYGTGAPVHEESLDLAPDSDITITLERTHTVAGVVVDAIDGTSLRDVDVSMAKVDTDVGGLFTGGGSRSVQSSADGRFRLLDVAPGRYRLSARRDGYSVATLTIEVAGADQTGVELRLEPSDGSTIFVRAPNGRAVNLVSVVALDGAGQIILSGSYTAGENGRVKLELPNGTWTLLVSSDGSATVEQVLEVPSSPTTIAVIDGATIMARTPALADAGLTGSLTARDAQGRLYRAASFGRMLSEWPSFGGRANIGPVPPGTWQLELKTEDGTVYRGTATVAPGVSAEVTLQ